MLLFSIDPECKLAVAIAAELDDLMFVAALREHGDPRLP